MKLRTTDDILTALELALETAMKNNDRELAKIIIVSCKHALQAQALNFAQIKIGAIDAKV